MHYSNKMQMFIVHAIKVNLKVFAKQTSSNLLCFFVFPLMVKKKMLNYKGVKKEVYNQALLKTSGRFLLEIAHKVPF